MGYGPLKGRADYYSPGDWNLACSMCGRKRKASQMVRNWQGQYRCPEHNEARQPQDFVRNVKDIMTVPFAQPETDTFTAFCSLNEISAIPGYGGPGCMIPGFILPGQIPTPPPPIPSFHSAIPAIAIPGFAWPGSLV